MAQSIPGPWIADYLISVAEQYGGKLSGVPPKEKGAKAQIVKFLTFPPSGATEPNKIWAEISDKKHLIPAVLTEDAIRKYMQDPNHGGKPVTSYKSAVVILKQLRPWFSRVPREGQRGMTPEPTICLEVDHFVLMGAYGAAMFDSPSPVSDDPKIKEWVHGLRQDGGGGNVLKLRKEREAALALERDEYAKRNTAAEPHYQTSLDAMNIKVKVTRKSRDNKTTTPIHDRDPPRPTVSKEAIRRASWKRFHSHMVKYCRPPDDVLSQLLSLCGESVASISPSRGKDKPSRPPGSGENDHKATQSASPVVIPSDRSPLGSRASTPQSSVQRSPSHWSPSIRGSPRPASDISSSETEEEEPEDDGDKTDSEENDVIDTAPNTSSTKLGTQTPERPKFTSRTATLTSPTRSMPPPATTQGREEPPVSSVPYTASLPPASADLDILPPSSLPVPTSSFRPSPTPTVPPHTISPAWSMPTIRRVPHPQITSIRPDPDASGEGRVLVENSDSASPGSQRLALSQSQSQSQSKEYSQTRTDGSQAQSEQSQSQLQRPSQLRHVVEISDSHENEESQARDGQGQQDETAAVEETPESVRTRQSLSYKGDSQSQDKEPTGETQPAPNTNGGDTRVPRDDDVSMNFTRDNEETEAAVEVDVAEQRLRLESSAMVELKEEPGSPRMTLASQTVPSAPAEESQQLSGPTWAALRTQVSLSDDSDSQEEEANVDELLSDPLTLQQQEPRRAEPVRRSKVARESKGSTSMSQKTRQLDSDDERTAAMVDQYVAEVQEQERKALRQVGKQSRVKAVREASPIKRPRLSSPAVVDVSKESVPKKRRQVQGHPKTPSRERDDVEMIVNEGEQRGAEPTQRVHSPAHDPVAWAAPTFMQPRNVVRQREAVSEIAGSQATSHRQTARKTVPRKRDASRSPSQVEEVPVAKKRKTSGSEAAIALSNTRHRASLAIQPSSHPGEPGVIPRSRQNSTPAHLPFDPKDIPRARTSALNVSRNPASLHHPHVHVRAMTHTSSQSSSRPSGSGQPLKPSQDRPSTGSDVKGKGKALPHSVGSEHEGAHVQPASSHQAALPRTKASSSRSSIRDVSTKKRPLADHEHHAARLRVVEECRASLHPAKIPGGPPSLTWDDLVDILRETGRARAEAAAAASRANAGA